MVKNGLFVNYVVVEGTVKQYYIEENQEKINILSSIYLIH